MDTQTLPEKLTLEKVIDLKKRFWRIYDENLKIVPVYSKELDEFNKIIYSEDINLSKKLNPKEIGLVIEQWYETLTKTPEYYSNMTGAPESVVDPNTLPPDQMDQLIEDQIEWSEKIKDTSISNKEDIDRALARKRDIANEQKTTITQTKPVDDFYSSSTIPPIYDIPNEKIEGEEPQTQKQVKHAYKPIDVPQKFPIDPRLKDFVVTVVPKDEEKLSTITLDEKQVETLQKYHQKAIENPEALHDEIVEKITNSIPTEEKAYVPVGEIDRQAQKFVEISKELPDQPQKVFVVTNPVAAFGAISNVDNDDLKRILPDNELRETIAGSAQIMARVAALEQENSVNLTPFLPKKLQEIYYGTTENVEFTTTTDTSRQGEGINVNISGLVETADEYNEIIQNVPKGEVDGRDIGFSGRQPVYIQTADPKVIEKTEEKLPWYKNSKHRTQADMYKNLHREPPVIVDATSPSGEVVSGYVADNTFVPSFVTTPTGEYKPYTNKVEISDNVKYTIAENNQFIPEVTNENGEQIKFDNFNDYSNYLSDAKNFGKDHIPRIKFSDGKTLSFNSLEEYTTYAGNIGTVGETYSLGSSTSSLNSFFQKNKVPILTTAAVGAYSVNNLQLMNFIAQSHGGQILMYKGIGQLSFSVVNTGNFVLGGVRREIYQAGFEFGSKSLKLAITKAGGKITSTALKIGTGTGTIVSKALPAVLSKVITALSAVGTPVLMAIVAAATFVVQKISEIFKKIIPPEKLKKFGSLILGALTVPLVAVFFGWGAGFLAGGGVILVSGILSGGIGGLSVGGAVSTGVTGITSALGAAFGLALAGIAGPILFILLGFPVIVALILFIINSGAYVVPPSPLSGMYPGSFSSPYIDVQKTSTVNTLKNSDLTKTISYTVIVKPKKGNLSNIKISDTCVVVSKTRTSCPAHIVPTTMPNIDTTNPTGGAFTYVMVIDPSYADSSIVNTVTITADVTGQSGVSASASNSIVIGNPPISCPLIGGRVTNGSYNGANNTGHGSQSYWQGTGLTKYPIPQSSGCMTPTDCSYYGYAADIFPSSSNDVFAPTVLGKDTSWNCIYAFPNDGGRVGYTYHCLSTDGNSMLVLTHMNQNVKSGVIKSGEKIGTLFNQGDNSKGGNTHLHMEFQLNGKYVKPENYFCK